MSMRNFLDSAARCDLAFGKIIRGEIADMASNQHHRPARRRVRFAPLAGIFMMVAASAAWAAGDVLPYPETPFKGKIGPTRETSVTAWPEQPKAPAGAPNVVVILLDDLGFGASATFGGPAASPELDKLAATGLRYNAINTTAI